MAMKTIFVTLTGETRDFGMEVNPSNAGGVYPEFDEVRYAPVGHINGLMIFAAVTEEKWAEIQNTIESSGGCFVSPSEG